MAKLEQIENGRKSISTRVPHQYELIIYEALVRARERFRLKLFKFFFHTSDISIKSFSYMAPLRFLN